MVIINNGEALIFDTPTDNVASNELINWLENVQKVVVKGVVITHFHDDCLGGITAFHKKEIPSYASNQTILLAAKSNAEVPQNGFEKSMELTVGNHKVINSFMGEGHTEDNIVSYYPAQEALFGGCLIKTNGATKGYLGDANVAEWPTTVEKVKATYPTVKTVIPGHGNTGGSELLDYTIRLFKK
jgi:metallo-beta-lactamase class B